ncbi:MAG: hypothetical protein ACYSWU_12870 [Planctomycetota bacterium]|jgi:hypothetical protein
MRAAVLGALAGAGLVLAAVGTLNHRNEVFAQGVVPYHQVDPSGELIAVPGPVGEKGQLLTVIDRKRQVMSVYHIHQATGKIALRSVRNIQWDLQLTYLDNEGLLPQEIQSLLDTR